MKTHGALFGVPFTRNTSQIDSRRSAWRVSFNDKSSFIGCRSVKGNKLLTTFCSEVRQTVSEDAEKQTVGAVYLSVRTHNDNISFRHKNHGRLWNWAFSFNARRNNPFFSAKLLNWKLVRFEENTRAHTHTQRYVLTGFDLKRYSLHA